jgi:hypothetical protein
VAIYYYYATFHNLGASLTIIIGNGDQYFKKKIIFMSKNLYNGMCQILIDGQQLMTSTWHHRCTYNGIA